MTPPELLSRLRAAHLVPSGEARLHALSGGVSSEIYLVETDGAPLVVKTALAQLRVRDAWFADRSRNGIEQAYFEYVARILPWAVPRVLGGDLSEGWFAMEYFGPDFSTWKERLLAGDAQSIDAQRAGGILGTIHRSFWSDAVARKQFATRENFHALRIEPYFLATAARVPALREKILAEADRLAATELTLVHGDYSPKNLLASSNRMVVLDAECGWYGDPAFDAAFLLTHLHLKALICAPEATRNLASIFWSEYCDALEDRASDDLAARTARLTLCLMLARVHGKSPVEYLKPWQAQYVCNFVADHLPRPPADPPMLAHLFHNAVRDLALPVAC